MGIGSFFILFAGIAIIAVILLGWPLSWPEAGRKNAEKTNGGAQGFAATFDRAQEDIEEFGEDLKDDLEDKLFQIRQGKEKMLPYLIAVGLPFYALIGMLFFWYVADISFGLIKGGMIFGIPIILVALLLDTIGFSTIFSTHKAAATMLSIWIIGAVANFFIGQVSTAEINTVVIAGNTVEADSYNDKSFDKDHYRKEYERLVLLTKRTPAEINSERKALLLTEPGNVKSRCIKQRGYGPWSRQNCPTVERLKAEYQNAKARITSFKKWTRAKTAFQGQTVARTDSDPFATTAEELTGIKKNIVSRAVLPILALFMTIVFPLMTFFVRSEAIGLREEALKNFARKERVILEKNGLAAPEEEEPGEVDHLAPTQVEMTNQLHVDLLKVFASRFEEGDGALSVEDIHKAYKLYVLEQGRQEYEPLGKKFGAAIDAVTAQREKLTVINGKLVGWVLKGQAV